MSLNDTAKWEEIQSKFKSLVKKYHPDKNHGNKKFEDKLKKITLAYSQLKKTLGKNECRTIFNKTRYENFSQTNFWF